MGRARKQRAQNRQQTGPKRKKTKKVNYKPYLIKFMSHKDGRKYGKDHAFSVEELLEITPESIAAFMYKRAYNSETPGENDRSHPIMLSIKYMRCMEAA